MAGKLRCRFIAAGPAAQGQLGSRTCMQIRHQSGAQVIQSVDPERRPYVKLERCVHAIPASAQQNESKQGGLCSALLQHLVIPLRNRLMTC